MQIPWWWALVFSSMISATAINPIAGGDELTNRAMSLLAIHYPEMYRKVIEQIEEIHFDPYMKGIGIDVHTGHVYVGAAELYRENPARWAGVLAHEAYHREAYWSCLDNRERTAILIEIEVASTLGARPEWFAWRWNVANELEDTAWPVAGYCVEDDSKRSRSYRYG